MSRTLERRRAKRERRRRIAAGLCAKCGSAPAMGGEGAGHLLCPDCGQRRAERIERRAAERQRRRDLNLCAKCGRRLPLGRGICSRCIAKREQRRARRRAMREQQPFLRVGTDLCFECGQRPALGRRGYRRRCAECAALLARDARSAKFQVAEGELAALYRAQATSCAMCGHEFESEQAAQLDHSHATGAVRGYLCTRCNTGLGSVERPMMLVQSAQYLAEADDAHGLANLLRQARLILDAHASE